MNAACAEGEETSRARLFRGELADLVVLSPDIFYVDAAEIDSTEVEMTVFVGRVIYEHR